MIPSRTELCKLLKDNRPARKNGRPTKESEKSLQSNEFPAKQGNTRLYIEERLKRDHPKVWKDYFGARELFLGGVVHMLSAELADAITKKTTTEKRSL